MRLEIRGVRVAYDGHDVLTGVSLAVPTGGWLGLIGPNGSGKTTLLRAVCGLIRFDGEVRLDGEPADTSRRRQLARRVAYVPQRPVLPAAMTVTDYVLLGRTPYITLFGTESRHDRAVAAGVLARLELDELATRVLGSLSGGEAQRAVLGRALAQEAPLLLLDEPTAALDVGHGQHVLELVDELRESAGSPSWRRCTTSRSPASSPTGWRSWQRAASSPKERRGRSSRRGSSPATTAPSCGSSRTARGGSSSCRATAPGRRGPDEGL